MATLKDLHGAGSGLVGVILPDTTSSVRYVNFDAPYLKKAFQTAGYSDSEFKIDNAQGDPATENLAGAGSDITQGAKVLIMDPLDSTVGHARSRRPLRPRASRSSATTGPPSPAPTPTTSASTTCKVGKLIGQGFLDCVKAWNVASPQVFTLNGGEDTDPNAIDFAKGYNSVVWGDAVPQETVGKTNNGATLVG